MLRQSSPLANLPGLPIELIELIAQYLVPEDIAKLARIVRRLRAMVRHNNIWRVKFEKHFPHRFTALNKPDTNWYVEFVKAYKEEYKVNAPTNWFLSVSFTPREQHLPLAVRRQFSLVKEGHASDLSKLSTSGLSGTRYLDSNGLNMGGWARKLNFQPVADVIFSAENLRFSHLDQKLKDKLDPDGLTMLHCAISLHQSINIIGNCISSGADVNGRFRGETAMTHAAQMNDNAGIMDELIKKGGDVNTETNVPRDYTTVRIPLLIFAILLGNKNIVDILLAHNVDVQRIVPIEWHVRGNLQLDRTHTVASGDNPLHVAIKLGRIDLVTALLDHGAEIETRTVNPLAETPLIIAVKLGRPDIVELLITRRANVNTTVGGATPLMWAILLGHEDVVDVLLKHHANVSPGLIVTGTIARGHYDIRSYKDINRYDFLKPMAGDTALHIAARMGAVSLVGKLLAADADLHARNIEGKTPVDVAKPGTRLAKELKLLEYSQNLEQKNDDEYKNTKTILGHQFRFGFSAGQEKPAVKALLQVAAGDADESTLDQHKKVINGDDELRDIYQDITKGPGRM